MINSTRRGDILATGVAATAMAAAPKVLAQTTREESAMAFFENGAVRIHYLEGGSGFPLLLIAGGGLNSTIEGIIGAYPPYNAMEEFKAEHRCVAFDLRNAPPANRPVPWKSTGPGMPTPTTNWR